MSVQGGDQVRRSLENLAKGFGKAVNDGVAEKLEEGKQTSVDTVHVITGALKGTIRVEMKGNGNGDLVAGGQDGVDYAAEEELGNSSREGHPFLNPGFSVATQNLPATVKKKVDALMR